MPEAKHPVESFGKNQAFLPKKALPCDGFTYERGNKFTTSLTREMISKFGPLPPNAIIHDNGCGSGAGVVSIMASNPPSGIKIYASDLSPGMVAVLQERVTEKGWPVEVRSGPEYAAQKLAFEDESFTHSISSLVIQYTQNAGVDACREIYRTLKPGGMAVINCFARIPHWDPILKTYLAMRDVPFPLPPNAISDWFSGELLRNALVEGGFDPQKVELSQITVPMRGGGPMGSGLEGFANFIWSTMGAIGGWSESDEEKWDESISMLTEELKKIPEMEFDDEGNFSYPCVLNVAFATK